MRKLATICFLLFSILISNAQSLEAFQSNSNALYWKNRNPYAGYWQQDVHYSIRAKLDDKANIIEGSEILTYQNNSPDTLYEVYFHLYQNAFQPNSYMSELMKAGKIETSYGRYEGQGLGTEILQVEQNDVKLVPIIDNTIMRLNLAKPIFPGQKAEFFIAFKTYFDTGSLRRRMKMFEHDGVKHYDGVHWYPRITVYDRKFGWTTDQHLGKEFYGDYGVYDVELQLPNQYIAEATGSLVNEKEVLPDELRKKLDISNFTKYSGTLTEIIKPDGTFKKWLYHAENVHDFAFTTDPSYRLSEAVWNGIICIAIAQEPNAHGWQKTAQYVADVVKIYSEDFGIYGYPKMVAADARDGMEYPMLTLNGGMWPGHRYVIAHEVGHNWFFGMVGNNETYSAGMDEGFTQFLTAWSLKKNGKIFGNPNPIDPGVVYFGYMNHATHNNTARLNIHSDHFPSAERHGGGYGQVYYKTASMLYNLQYVLGDALFEDAMKHYFNQWKFAHPYWEDFRNSIINYTKVDLNWFFDQWLTTTETIDYKVQKIKKLKGTSAAPYAYEVTFKRKGSMQMPIDFAVTDKKGSTYEYLIPNTWYQKEGGQAVLAKWTGWGLLNPTYKTKIELNAPIKNLVIDPSERMADINRLNNSKKLPTKWWFDNMKQNHSDYLKYHMSVRPDLWYNAIDGVKAGLHWDGNYFNTRHVAELAVWYNTGAGATVTNIRKDMFSYKLKYTDAIGYLTNYSLESRYLDGMIMNKLGLEKSFLNGNKVEANFKSMYLNIADYQFNSSYLYNDFESWNNAFNVTFSHPYKYFKGNGIIKIDARASAFTADYDYSWIGIEAINNNRLGKTNLKSRFFARAIGGQNTPFFSSMSLGGANNEQMLESKYSRSRGIIPDDWANLSNNSGQFHMSGNLNLRGYSNYLATNNDASDTFYIFNGKNGTSLNLEWDFTQVFNIKMSKLSKYVKVNTYLFSDAGMLWNDKGNSGVRADAGLGTLWNLQLPKRTKAEPLQVRVDFPFFLNRIPVGEENYLAFRWQIGLQKAF
jgi:hypothetical protein